MEIDGRFVGRSDGVVEGETVMVGDEEIDGDDEGIDIGD